MLSTGVASRSLARVSGDNNGFSVKRFETFLSGGQRGDSSTSPKNSDDLNPADVATRTTTML